MAKKQSSKPISKTTSRTSEPNLAWLPKKTFELTLTVPKTDVQKAYNQTLEKAQQNTTLKGFRKGKAPKNLVEQSIGKAKLLEQTAQTIITKAYQEAIQHHHLHPIIPPKIEPQNIKENEDWILKATSCEAPEVKLGKYQDAIKGLKAKDAIWTPEKAAQQGQALKDGAQEQESQQIPLEKIFDELLKTSQADLSDLLIEDETNRLLSNLLDQVNATGITMQQYLNSKNLTQEQLKAQYQETAEKSLKIEFIIAQISQEQNITASASDLTELINRTQDPKTKETMQHPSQQAYLKMLLRKQKTVDFLKNL